MNILVSAMAALTSLISNKLRAALTMLGIIIGVAAVIVLVSLGNGLQKMIDDSFAGFGSNLLYVVSVSPGESATMAEMDKAQQVRNALGISNADADALRDAPDVLAVAPSIERWATVSSSRDDTTTTVFATTPETADMRNWSTSLGRYITEEDVVTHARVAVLGWDVVEDLFPPGVVPLGERIRIEGQSFRVVGILEEKGGMFGQSMDDVVIVPVTTAQRYLFNLHRRDGQPEVGMVQVQVDGQERMDAATGQIVDILRQRHHITYRDADDFEVISQDEMLASLAQITGALTLFLGIIAGISLLVGGIGIMNIMLVSVTERTREIGLRKALGAKRRDILTQFLVESSVLAFAGGILGILLGAAGSMAAAAAVPDLPAHVSGGSVLLATSISAGVGIAFGLYPAWRAARLNPIDALRYE